MREWSPKRRSGKRSSTSAFRGKMRLRKPCIVRTSEGCGRCIRTRDITIRRRMPSTATDSTSWRRTTWRSITPWPPSGTCHELHPQEARRKRRTRVFSTTTDRRTTPRPARHGCKPKRCSLALRIAQAPADVKASAHIRQAFSHAQMLVLLLPRSDRRGLVPLKRTDCCAAGSKKNSCLDGQMIPYEDEAFILLPILVPLKKDCAVD
jgi:hypothetical protein